MARGQLAVLGGSASAILLFTVRTAVVCGAGRHSGVASPAATAPLATAAGQRFVRDSTPGGQQCATSSEGSPASETGQEGGESTSRRERKQIDGGVWRGQYGTETGQRTATAPAERGSDYVRNGWDYGRLRSD